MAHTIRWGIIGVGNVTELKSGPAFQKIEGSELVAVMRRNGDMAKDYAERHGVPRWYDDGQALIADPEVDAVYIATPPDSHCDYTLMCAQAGKPVYVEKPMARNYDECLRMIESCAKQDVKLWVAYYRRALPRFLKVKEWIDSGTIGEIRSVRTIQYGRREQFDAANLPWRVLPEIAGGGFFVDVGSHTLDLLDYFFGAIQSVQGMAVNQLGLYPAEDHVVANYVFESGVVGSGVWCFTAGDEIDENEIVGSSGKIVFSTFENKPIRLITAAGEQSLEISHPENIQHALIQTIVDEINGEGKCPSTGVSGARTSWVIDEILRDYRHA